MKQSLERSPERSVWDGVHRSITRPVAWILIVAGVAVWISLVLVEWFRQGELTAAWLASTAVGIGVALLVVGIGYEQYRDWKNEPYKDIDL